METFEVKPVKLGEGPERLVRANAEPSPSMKGRCREQTAGTYGAISKLRYGEGVLQTTNNALRIGGESRSGKKIPRLEPAVPVRFRSRAPFL